MKNYTVLMADMKRSQSYDLAYRRDLQNYISATAACLNELFAPVLVKPVDFSAGDEIQGLFAEPISAYLYYRMFGLVMGPQLFRCGIGVGAWDVRPKGRSDSMAQDGEAYHLAREAVGEAHRNDYYDLVALFSSRGVSRSRQEAVGLVLPDHSWGICKMRTETQNETALVVELISPLAGGDEFPDARARRWLSCRERLLGLYASKQRDAGRNSSLAIGLLEKDRLADLPLAPRFFGISDDDYDCRRDPLYGSSRRIAEMAGMSQQGLSRKIAQGRVFQERNAVALLADAWREVARWCE